MGYIDRMTIKGRLLGAFLIVILFFAAFGLFALGSLNQMEQMTADLYRHPFMVSNSAIRVSLGVAKMHSHMKDVVASRSQVELGEAVAAVRVEEQEVLDALNVVGDRVQVKKGERLNREVRDLFSTWRPIIKETVKLMSSGEHAAAEALIKEKSEAHVALLEERVHELVTHSRNRADGYMSNANRVAESVNHTTVISIVGISLVALVVALFFSRSIILQLTRLGNKMAEISETGELTVVAVEGANETSRLARHFNYLVETLRDQLWLRSGIGELGSELTGELGYSEISEKAVSYLARSVEACAGAIYTLSHTDGVSELKSGYALNDDKHFPQTFGAGNGLVGQVAMDGAPIHLTGISPDEKLLNLATTEQPPREIYAVPLRYNGRVYGVAELASFKPFTEIKRNFINEAAQIIATSLYTSEQNKKVRDLLDQTQLTNEELNAKSQEVERANEELAATNEELEAQSIELHATSEELRAQAQELHEQQRQLERADQLKSEFLSNMSHELRTPLNSILALSQLMISKGVGKNPEKEVEFLGVIERNGRRLLGLINDILDLSKIESGRMEVDFEELNPCDVATEAVETVRPLAKDKQLALAMETGGCPMILSDAGKVQQILVNLLSNAIKFTEHGGVSLNVSQVGEEVHFTVTDTGIGIPKDHLDTIFDEFRQVDGSTTRRHEGTGLGLAICRKLSVMLGGDIEIVKSDLNGSTFLLRLPVGGAAAQLETDELSVSRARVNKKSSLGLSLESNLAAIGGGEDERQLVLVVDDEPKMRELISGYLTDGGYRVVTAASGEEALELATELKPFAITLDIMLPGIDGWEVMKSLKSKVATEDIPVIVVSMSEDAGTGEALGASGCLQKPVSQVQLLDEIAMVQNFKSVQKILVVDDDEDFCIAMQEFLTGKGFIASTLSESPMAVEEVVKSEADLVVLDLMMPQMNGFQVLEQLKLDPRTNKVPVVVMTAKDLTAEERERLMVVTDTVITKGSSGKEQLLGTLISDLEKLQKRETPTEPRQVHTASSGEEEQVGVRKLLVVEDNEIAVIQISTALEDIGHEVLVARNGEEGLKVLQHTIPDAIILDLMMPGVDGFEVLENLRSKPETLELPVLVLTAKELTREDKARLSRNNITQLIKKGEINRSQLVERIRKLFIKGDSSQKAAAAHAGQKPKPAPVKQIAKAASPIAKVPTSPKAWSGSDKPKILAVEDNPDNVITLQAVLDGLGVECVFAGDGQEGVELAKELIPDLILMDIQLPGMSGVEATRVLRGTASTAEVPIIALTAKAMKGDREELLAEGLSDYLAKPYDPESIGAIIEKWLPGFTDSPEDES